MGIPALIVLHPVSNFLGLTVSPQHHNKDGLLGLNSIMVVYIVILLYMDPLGVVMTVCIVSCE